MTTQRTSQAKPNTKTLGEMRERLTAISSKLHKLARQGKVSEVWLIRFDGELIKAVDALDSLLFLAEFA